MLVQLIILTLLLQDSKFVLLGPLRFKRYLVPVPCLISAMFFA